MSVQGSIDKNADLIPLILKCVAMLQCDVGWEEGKVVHVQEVQLCILVVGENLNLRNQL